MNGWALLTQLDLLWPWMIVLLPAPWLVRRLLPPAEWHQPLQAPILHAMLQQARTQMPSALRRPVRRTTIPPWAWLLWSLLVLAAMRPVWYLTPTPLQREGRDMMLAVDLSGSMEKRDLRLYGRPADRLSVVKAVVRQFIERREGDRIGLIVFGSQAFLISPLTHDLQTVQTLLEEAEIGMAGDNTAIGDAIGLAIRHLRRNGQRRGTLILLTDGANTDGWVSPLEAADKAAKTGLKIHTIAIGRAGSTGGSYDYDEQMLRRIAERTGGRFFSARNRAELEAIYDEIDRIERIAHTVHTLRAHTELFHWPLGAALLLSLLIAWRRSRTEPS